MSKYSIRNEAWQGVCYDKRENAMDEKDTIQKCSWSEGLVGKNSKHTEITYKENFDSAALLSKGDGKNFAVQFLIAKEQPDNGEILNAVHREQEKDPWLYAEYHCTTASTIYSNIH